VPIRNWIRSRYGRDEDDKDVEDDEDGQ